MIHLKKFLEQSAPAVIPLSWWKRLGKTSANANAKKKMRIISDDEIRKRKALEKVRTVYREKSNAPIWTIASSYSGRIMNSEDNSSRFHQKASVNRVFSVSLRPKVEDHIYVDRLGWNNSEKGSLPVNGWGKSVLHKTGKVILPEINAELQSHQFYPEKENEEFGARKRNLESSNKLRFKIKLTRDMYRAFARLQESEGFVPGLIDTQEVLYKDDFRALLTCLGAYPTKELIDEAFSRADTKGRGWISYRRFLNAKSWILSQGHEAFDYDSLFDMLNFNKDGTLSIEELSGLTTASGHVLTSEEAAVYFKEINKSSEDVITREEFVQILSRRQDLAWILRTGYRVIFVLGPPASGKGTYCEELKKRLNINHVSTGELLREEVDARTTLGKRVEQIMKRGDLVDSSTTTVLIQKYLRVNPGKHVLVDGFPRSMQNSTDFLQLCGRPEFALVFDAPDEVLMERMRNRAQSSGREDDKNENTGRRRIQVYRETNNLIIENLIKNGVAVYTIDATRPKEENIRKITRLMRNSKNEHQK